MIYLLTVMIAYFGIGLLLVFGMGAVVSKLGDMLTSVPVLVGQLALGIALMLLSWAMDTKRARARAAERAASGGGKLLAWRARIMSGDDVTSGSSVPLVALAITAVLLELATMLPYLAAVGLITTRAPQWPMPAILLVGYCLVMILPAIILLFARVLGRRSLDRPLQRLDAWLTKNAQSTTAWIIGIVGFLLAVNAIADLGWVNTGT